MREKVRREEYSWILRPWNLSSTPTLRCVERRTEQPWPVSSGTASLMLILDGDSEDSVLENAEKIAKALEESGSGETFITK